MQAIGRLRVLFAVLAMAGAVAVGVQSVGAQGVSGPAFYVDGVLYRTVATPAELSNTGAPDHTFDIIYNFFGAQIYNVAEAAPGDTDFNGGRWAVHRVTFADYGAALAMYDANGSGDFDSAEEVEAAIAGGLATDGGVVRRFVCTVNKVPNGGA